MDNLIIVVAGVIAVVAILSAAYAVKRVLDQSESMCHTVVALRLSNGDPIVFRQVQTQLTGDEEPEEPIVAEEPKPLAPVQVGNDEVIDLVAHGASVDELLGTGWRTT